MDIFFPDLPHAPFVLFVHGGLWYSGSRVEINEVCKNVLSLSNNTVGCATIDYHYSQDLGGGCASTSLPTYQKQAEEVSSAFKYLASRSEVDPSNILLGGHSAGGHLAAWLSFNWNSKHQDNSPVAFAGVEGIYNVSLWDQYDNDHWDKKFYCPTRQAFGDPVSSAQVSSSNSHMFLIQGLDICLFLLCRLGRMGPLRSLQKMEQHHCRRCC